jgi:hypothetical protein
VRGGRRMCSDLHTPFPEMHKVKGRIMTAKRRGEHTRRNIGQNPVANHENRHQKSQHLGRIESANHALHTAWNGISSIFTSNNHKEKCICAFGISFRMRNTWPGPVGPNDPTRTIRPSTDEPAVLASRFPLSMRTDRQITAFLGYRLVLSVRAS